MKTAAESNVAQSEGVLALLQDAYDILGVSYPLTQPDMDKRAWVLSALHRAITITNAKGEAA